jgi:hypothetical protein
VGEFQGESSMSETEGNDKVKLEQQKLDLPVPGPK